MGAEVRRFGSLNDLSLHAAQWILQVARQAVRERGRFTFVLSGGETPRALYTLLAEPPCLQLMPWKGTFFFWGDERCVPPGHPASNYGQAKKLLLDKIPISSAQVFPIPGDLNPPEAGAKSYAKTLRDFFSAASKDAAPSDFPVFDLVLLGMGTDGHVASLFPGHPALDEERHWVVYAEAPPEHPVRRRLTLTLPLFNRARQVLFLVSGKGKGKMLQAVLAEEGNLRAACPAARVAPAAPPLWLIDQV